MTDHLTPHPLPRYTPPMTTTKDLIESGRFHPLPGLLVARIDRIQSRGLIVLPSSAQFETDTATIVAIGPDLPDYLELGAKVLPHSAAGRSIYEDDSVRFVAYKLEDLQAVFQLGSDPEKVEQFILDHAGKTEVIEKTS